MNFNALGLKKLITTCFATSPVTGKEFQYYVDNETQREQLSRNAIEMVKHFDVSIIANQWLDLFQGL